MESFIPAILENFLGQPKNHSEYKGQISFDCPLCDEDNHKGNLEINYEKGVYKCWSCKELNNMYGPLSKLIRQFGTKTDYKNYLLLKPDFDSEKDKARIEKVLEIPDGLKLISDNIEILKHSKILEYLTSRNIDESIIKKFSISYTNTGKYKSRVIVPSFSSEGKMEYFVSRAFEKWVKPKYLNPDVDKETIIFFENNINWDATIYLVEGVFDAIVIPNAIPILGKFISDKLFLTLQEKAKADVIILLDGDAYSDAKKLYIKLNVMNLFNKVKIIVLGEKWDVSLINEKFGKKGLKHVLATANYIRDSML